MKLALTWADPTSVFRDGPMGLRLERNPVCQAWLDTQAWLDATKRCGKPATVRVNRLPYWSLMWCPEHADAFEGRIP